MCRHGKGDFEDSASIFKLHLQATLIHCNFLCISRYSTIQWSATGLMLQGLYALAPRSPGSRIVVIGVAFTATLLSGMYIATVSLGISVLNFTPQIRGIDDLANRPIGVPSVGS